MNKRLIVTSLILVIILGVISVDTSFAEEEVEYYTIVDEEGNVIFETAMEIHLGDYYINQDNDKYTIVEINGNQGVARFEERVKLVENEDELFALSQSLLAQGANKEVALYNTHSAESYVPTSGTDSKLGDGDVYDVAHIFGEELEARGINVNHDWSKHDPHDGGAYERSRRTAVDLVEGAPDALLDIHRDGVPNPDEYVAEVNGETVGQVRLVVGRQNPQLEVNDQFAGTLKAISDEFYPGLMHGIFYAQGKYNQDLSPRALLIEFGTHVIPQEQAVAGAKLFADVVDKALYGGDDPGATEAGGTTTDATKAGESAGATRSIIIVLLIAVLGGGFLLIANEGGLGGAVDKVKGIGGKMNNAIGIGKKDEKEKKEEDKKGKEE